MIDERIGIGRVERVMMSALYSRPGRVYVTIRLTREEDAGVCLRNATLADWVQAGVSGGPKALMDVLLFSLKGRHKRMVQNMLLGKE